MIKPHRNQIKVNAEKVNRHSSQLAIRKTSCQSTTPRDQDIELRNIRQTTFWMKKTVGVSGVQNLHPNARKICPSRSRQVFSMKVNTDHSETDSACLKKIQQMDCNEVHPKLSLLQKTQIQTGAEINMVINENLPKLTTCQHLFNSLNKSIKLAYKTVSKAMGIQLERMLDQHLQLSTLIFEKVLAHSNDFIQNQKCSHLISKTIEQQKQNSKLMSKCGQLTEIIQKMKNSQNKKKDQLNINLRSIDLQRIQTANYRVGQYVQLGNVKINQICKQILKPIVGFGSCLQIGYFQITNSVVSKLIISKEGSSVIKLLAKKDKNKQDQQKSLSLNKNLVNNILKSTLDLQVFNLVKKKTLRFLNSHKNLKYEDNQKMDIKTAICLTNKLSILRDKIKQKEILINLLSMIQVADRQRSLTQTQLNQISAYIQQDYAQIYKKSVLSDKINRLNNKRLVNCANLYQKKKKKNNSPNHKHENDDDAHEPQTSFRLKLNFYVHDIVVLAYYYVVNQLEYLANAAHGLAKFDENQDSGWCVRIVEKLVAERFVQMVKNNEGKQKLQIFDLSMSLARAYGQDSSIKQQCKEETMRQLLKLINYDILKALSEEKRLVLSELANEIMS